ncbi:MAG: POTRA domain-containing protein [Trueperaceae bacterium]|nr:POTRA domain-containing protein [Trueperaceae bacterium]
MAAAQAPSGEIVEVRVIGASESVVNLVRVNLNARPGTPIERIDLEAERNRVLSLGTFSEVSVRIEDRGNGPILFVEVVENPPVAEIVIEGSRYPQERLLEILDEVNLLSEGAVFNTFRAQEAIETIRRVYRESGWPFEVPVRLDVEAADPDATKGDVPLRLTYTVTETVPLAEVTFTGNTVLSEAELRDLFAPVARQARFDFDAYQLAARATAAAYEERGFRGSGVNPDTTQLVDETLIVDIRELRIASIDTTAIGVDPSALSLSSGDLFNYDVLLQDVREVAQGRTSDIRLEYPATRSGEVRVVFRTGPPESAGPVDAISVEGNTVFSDAELIALFSLQVGDTFSSELASEDFRRLQERYRDAGYLIVTEPDFNYLDGGTYVQRVGEVVITEYDVVFEAGEGRTNETVITRYLPDPGSVYNQNELREGLLDLARLGIVEPLDVQLDFAGGQIGTSAVASVIVRERQTRVFQPQANYATDSGFSASIGFSDSNFLGRGNQIGIDVSGQTSDIGLLFGGSLSYSIPWLYVDLLDFQEVPTSLSVSVFSVINTDQALTDGGQRRVTYPGLPSQPDDSNEVFVGDYAQRDTGLRFSVSRPILTDTAIRFSARANYSAYRLEPPEQACSFDSEGNIEDPDCALPEDLARGFLPQSGLASFISTEVVYDSRDSPEFPTTGVRANALAGVGFGSDYRDPQTREQRGYVYQQFTVGARTYLALDNPAHVFAFRGDAGIQFGGDYPTSKYFAIGGVSNEATLIRGYNRDDLSPSQVYGIGSVEYRYDFGLSTAVTQTIIGVIFTDVGYVSSVPDVEASNLLFSAGAGVQINVGFGGGILAPIRLDYGFSPVNTSGALSFRLGYVF